MGYFNLSWHSSQTTGTVSQSCGWWRKGAAGSPQWKSCSSGWAPRPWSPPAQREGPACGSGQSLQGLSQQPAPQSSGLMWRRAHFWVTWPLSSTQVSAVPTVLAMKNGDVVDKFVGIKDEDQLEAFLKKLIGWQARMHPDCPCLLGPQGPRGGGDPNRTHCPSVLVPPSTSLCLAPVGLCFEDQASKHRSLKCSWPAALQGGHPRNGAAAELGKLSSPHLHLLPLGLEALLPSDLSPGAWLTCLLHFSFLPLFCEKTKKEKNPDKWE